HRASLILHPVLLFRWSSFSLDTNSIDASSSSLVSVSWVPSSPSLLSSSSVDYANPVVRGRRRQLLLLPPYLPCRSLSHPPTRTKYRSRSERRRWNISTIAIRMSSLRQFRSPPSMILPLQPICDEYISSCRFYSFRCFHSIIYLYLLMINCF
ncbi:hypothetical protein PMAYCL1PPCAC_28754, partial [Pristionchus mayeri]